MLYLILLDSFDIRSVLILNKILQVIIDSQPLTVAILAAGLYGESIGFVGAAGLVLGVVGLLLLEVFNRNPKITSIYIYMVDG